ncbi:MAG: hypothetical protein VB144_11515 [Clostridia bacterium]|nr:hypothetical protein [Clostridia bacterium]
MPAKLDGLDEAIAELNAKLAEVEGLTAEAVRDTGLAVLSQAVQDAPVETGDLRRSGSLRWDDGTELTAASIEKNGKTINYYESSATSTKLSDVVATGADPSKVRDNKRPDGCAMVIVGFSVPYAAAQHEGVDFDHPKGGKAKFLEDAIKSVDLTKIVQDKAGGALK